MNKKKDIVRKKYSDIARSNQSGCCDTAGCCSNTSDIVGYTIMRDDYQDVEGYFPEADLQLGCGIPTEFADIKAGDTVVDLGSGAGNDVFVCRHIAGAEGKVIGIDFTSEMIEKANLNKTKLGYDNIEFKLGDIENIPLEDGIADVVVSNCVLNLVPDKQKAFAEIYRILKKGGHFCISDIVLNGVLPMGLMKSAEMYAGCISGAVQKDDYLNIIKEAGFSNVEIKKIKAISLPDLLLLQHLSPEEINSFRKSNTGIYSITVVAEKK